MYWEHFRQGLEFEKRGDLKEAIQMYESAIRLDATLPWAHFHMGNVRSSLGRFEEAIEAYSQAICCDPSWPWSSFKKSQVLSKIDRHDEAVSAVMGAIEVSHDDAFFHCQLGEVLTAKGDVENAIAAYQESIRQDALVQGIDPEQLQWDLSCHRGPDFVCPGFAKSGTTSLYEYITHHPQVLPAAQKEPMFFDNRYDLGLDWYLSQVPSIPTTLSCVTGEASTRYIEHPDAHSRMHYHFPAVKIILLLRNPTEWALSDYYMGVARGYETRSIETVFSYELSTFEKEGVEGLLEIADKARRGRTPFPSYILGSLYANHIRRWMAYFPREQFLFLTSDELLQTPERVLDKVFRFLGLPDCKIPHCINKNSAGYDYATESIHHVLSEFFYSHNKLLTEMLESDLKVWET